MRLLLCCWFLPTFFDIGSRVKLSYQGAVWLFDILLFVLSRGIET